MSRTTTETNILMELCESIFGPNAVWQKDRYSGRGFSPAEAPELPSAAGLPMAHVGRLIRGFLEDMGLSGATVRMRDRIAGDGEVVADIIISPEAHRKLPSIGDFFASIFKGKSAAR